MKYAAHQVVTSTMYMFDAFCIGIRIKQMSTSKDVNLSMKAIVDIMKKKDDKYWGNIDSIKMLLMISLVLHPTYKLKFMNWLSVGSSSLRIIKKEGLN